VSGYRIPRPAAEWAVLLTAALLLTVAVRAVVAEQFVVTGPSMEAELFDGDRVLVNKVAYRFTGPSRGDVVVFGHSLKVDGVPEHRDLIKRVVGLPGETVEVRACTVFVDGLAVSEPWLEGGSLLVRSGDSPGGCGLAHLAPVVLGADQVFVLGDNRAMSVDSRVFGPVGLGDVVGKVLVAVWPPSRVFS